MAGALHSAAAAPRAQRARASRARQSGGARALTLALLPVCAALALRTVAIEPFAVTSESMLPTLRPGDRVFVNKLAYGARLPFGAPRLPALREPARGDLVVFAGAGDERERFVKRIVGLPGERISQRDGVLLVNGVAPEAWATGTIHVDGARRPLSGSREQLGSCEHALLRDPAAEPRELEVVVPEGHYFVLGDNRDHSADSRDFGPVSRERLIGPVMELLGSGPRFERPGGAEE